MQTLKFNLGFKLNDIYFGMSNGELYQLPYTFGGKYYALRKIRRKKLKNNFWEFYHIRRKKVGVEKLRSMLQYVEWEIEVPPKI